MAFHISIVKLSEDHDAALYRFIGDGDREGTFSIDTKSGDVTLIDQMPGDEGGHFLIVRR